MRNAVVGLGVAVAIIGLAAPLASASPLDPPPGSSDECTLTWVSAEAFGSGRYFGDSRLQCPVPTDTGWRWELDGVEIERGTQSRLGPGEVPVFDDLEVATAPGRELCFFPQAWGDDKGRACVTT
jgi:hypothetical protein